MKNNNRLVRRSALVAARVAVFAALISPAVFAQDSSGNSQLSGAYRFRYIANVATSSNGTVIESTAAEGVMTFDGNGNYTISTGSQWVDNTVSNGAFQTIPQNSTGVYAINAAGIGYISNPNPNQNLPGTAMFGTFSQGVFTASTTEEGQDEFGDTIPAINDLLVAVAVGPVPTTSSFTSPYWIGTLDFAQGLDSDVKNALFKITPNGSGGLGSLSIQGQANSNTATCVNGPSCLLTQNVSGATYSFASDGNGQFSIPAPSGVAAPQVLVSGSRNVYVSADGNFLLGWTTNGYDIMFGVKALPSSVAGTDNLFTGLYFLGGIGDYPTAGGTQGCGPFSFWGSENADGAQNEWEHQRLYWPACANFTDGNGYPLPYDFGTWNETGMNATADGTAQDSPLGFLFPGGSNYAFGDIGGKCVPSVANATCAYVAISNTSGTMGLTIGVHTPNFSGSGVYLNPIGVVNAASFDPITTSVAPGEFLSLFGNFGTNIPSSGITAPAGGFPTNLGSVQVTINGTLAPIYYVSPGQINVIAPFELASATTNQATIQVSSNGLLSNAVSVYLMTDATPGIFSYGPNGDGASDGIGYAIAEHANGSLITASNPAQPGETIVLGMGGLGAVTPGVSDGAVPSSTTLSYVNDFTNGDMGVYFHDYDNNVYFQNATIAFAGLYPGFPGEYQMNVTVPTTVGPGPDIYIEVITPYADVVQVSVPVGGSANASAARTEARKGTGFISSRSMTLPPVQLTRKTPEWVGPRPAARGIPVWGKREPVAPASPRK